MATNIEGKVKGREFLPLSGLPKGTLQVIPECEIEPENGESLELLDMECDKNPGHLNFISPSEFTLAHVPQDYQREKTLDYIKYWSDLTVRVVVRFTSYSRPDTFADSNCAYPFIKFKGSSRKPRYGTGTIVSVWPESNSWDDFYKIPPEIENLVESCPCRLCKTSGDPQKEFWTIKVQTATHVIFDDSEAECATFECFYDSEIDKDQNVKKFYGFKILDTDYTEEERWRLDFVEVACVTHDRELAELLDKLAVENCPRRSGVLNGENNLGVMISHPHGLSKKITIGNFLHVTIPVNNIRPHDRLNKLQYFSEWTVCRLPLFPWWKTLSGDNQIFDLEEERIFNDLLNTDMDLFSNPGYDGDKETMMWLSQCNTRVKKFEFPVQAGALYLLPKGIRYILPKEAEYVRRYHSLCSPWFMLPPGTKFYLPNGSSIMFPSEAEFTSYVVDNEVSYVTYNVGTCPGSSGAGIIQDVGVRMVAIFNHYGSLSGANRSGVQYYNGYETSKPLKWMSQESLRDFLKRLSQGEQRGEASAY